MTAATATTELAAPPGDRPPGSGTVRNRPPRAPGRRPAVLGAAVLGVVLLVTLLGPLTGGDPGRTVSLGYLPPEPGLPLGTDRLGRDVLALLLHGGAGLVGVALLSTLVAETVGVLLGLALSVRGRLSSAVAAAVDVALVVPSMLTMLILLFGLGRGVSTMVVITTVVSAPFVSRYVRALARPVLDAPYVMAARTSGDPWPLVLVREVLPTLVGPVLADTGMRVVGVLYLVASAGFLGFDPLGSGTDWATMVQANRDGLRLNPWAAAAPALAIAAITVPANLLADRAVRRVQR